MFFSACDIDTSSDHSGGISDFSDIETYVGSEITITGPVVPFTGFLDSKFYEYAVKDKNGYHVLFIPLRTDQSFNQGDVVVITGIIKKKLYGGKDEFFVIEPTQPIEITKRAS